MGWIQSGMLAGGADETDMPDYFVLETCGPTSYRWTPLDELFTPIGLLQGGAGLGAAIAAMEHASGRPVVWATAQYLSFAAGAGPIDLHVTIEVAGHNTTQARCVVAREGHEILTAHAALGSRDFPLAGTWCSLPVVSPPDACPPVAFFERGKALATTQIARTVEFRLAHGRQIDEIEAEGGRSDGWFAMWVRWPRGDPVTAADLAFIGDFLPTAFADAAGGPYVGNSLDNTIRIGRLVPTAWVLLSIQVQQVTRGFGYGRAELWSQDGVLLGEVSQSVVMRAYTNVDLTDVTTR